MSLGGFSMFDLYKVEAEQHGRALSDGLVALETATDPALVEPLMRAAHSIKGAARIVGFELVVTLAHAMEDCLVRLQRAQESIVPARVDQLLKGTDLLVLSAQVTEAEVASWSAQHAAVIEHLARSLQQPASSRAPAPAPAPATAPSTANAPAPAPTSAQAATPTQPNASTHDATTPARTTSATQVAHSPADGAPTPSSTVAGKPAAGESSVMVRSRNLDRLMRLSGEGMVEARRLDAMRARLRAIRTRERVLEDLFDRRRQRKEVSDLDFEQAHAAIRSEVALLEADLQAHLRRTEELSTTLHHEAIDCRMRPFGDACLTIPRTVRDLARSLDKDATAHLEGQSVSVDRDILRKLEAPLTHLVRNALDHGIESRADRMSSGKRAQATLRVSAVHQAGMLVVEVADDGRGIDLAKLRTIIVQRNLSTPELVARMSDREVTEFLFLPGFSTAKSVTDLSGRGVGLDVVQSTVHEVGGSVEVHTEPGRGTTFRMRLPVTLSVLRAAIVSIAGEPYAMPLARMERIDRLEHHALEHVEGRLAARVNDEVIGLVRGDELLGIPGEIESGTLAVVSLRTRQCTLGVIVDGFLGEEDVVVQPLDERLGTVPHVSSASVRQSGELVLILDVDAMAIDAARRLDEGTLRGATAGIEDAGRRVRRVLVVEDSLTVREVERQMLVRAGYQVDVAVDGLDGWNALQRERYDLVLSDVDMPRMNGLDLVRRIRADRRLALLPVVMVSYKDREEDRLAGLDAGATAYLTKGAFHDRTLLDTVADLIDTSRE
ncbi:MAG: hybrid sensor histidine kinase/response regulator [Phycisphaerae bacterium]|nr:hybrid sensor histidine kinase/response regulator [Phycisphaerae bacterium]